MLTTNKKSSTIQQLVVTLTLALSTVSYARNSEANNTANINSCVAALSSPAATTAQSKKLEQPWFEKISFEKIEEILRSSEIISSTDLLKSLRDSGKSADGSTRGMQLLTFADGTQAVWKPENSRSMSEVAAYRAARVLGLKLIPPTVEREINGVNGSTQFFVKTSLDLVKMGRKQREEIWSHVSEEQKSDRDVFNFVFGQWDLHWGNILVDDSFSIVMIDNGAISVRQKVRFGERPFLNKFKLKYPPDNYQPAPSFPFDDAINLMKPTHEEAIAVFSKYADRARVEEFFNRRKNNADLSMRIAIWDNSIWIQALGFHNYPVISPKTFSPTSLDKLKNLNVDILRTIFPEEYFSDKYIAEILERREQILSVARISQ